MRFKEVHDSLYGHFRRRFGLKGVVQTYLAWCEVSKGVVDLYSNKGIPYQPYGTSNVSEILAQEKEKYGFDMDINSLPTLMLKCLNCFAKAVRKFEKQWAEVEAAKRPLMLTN